MQNELTREHMELEGASFAGEEGLGVERREGEGSREKVEEVETEGRKRVKETPRVVDIQPNGRCVCTCSNS